MTLKKSFILKALPMLFAMLLVFTIVNPNTASANSSLKGFKYNSKVPMPKAHQEYLYKKTKERGLDYKETLAVIKVESSFNPKEYYVNCYGYFQVWKGSHKDFAKALKTKNKPFDPYVNINWGTYELSNLTKHFKKQGLKGTKLREAVLSAYNKGLYGYKKSGKATSYINKNDKALKQIKSWY